jgi:hypothetical protein
MTALVVDLENRGVIWQILQPNTLNFPGCPTQSCRITPAIGKYAKALQPNREFP